MNKVILIGRLCNDPEIKYVGKNNTAVTEFTLAVDRDYKNSDGNYDTDFINCQLWDKSAEIFCKYMSKGKLVGVDGKLNLEKYTSADGQNKIFPKVNCESFNFIPSSKSKNLNSINIINSDNIFDSENNIGDEFSESEIPI